VYSVSLVALNNTVGSNNNHSYESSNEVFDYYVGHTIFINYGKEATSATCINTCEGNCRM
jgi:hypothetical protein